MLLLTQKFQLFDTIMTLPATSSADREPVDFDLSIVFKCLDVKSVLLVVTMILTQQRLVFTSSSYPLLTLVTKVDTYDYYFSRLFVFGPLDNVEHRFSPCLPMISQSNFFRD